MGARQSSRRKARAPLPSSSEPRPESPRPPPISSAALPHPQPPYTSPPASSLEQHPRNASNFNLYSSESFASSSATLPPYDAPDTISVPTYHDFKSPTLPSSSISPSQVPLYFRSPPPPRPMDTALSMVKECLSVVKEASDMFLPLKAALVGFLKVWEVYERTTEVQDDFIELAGKLAALNDIATRYQHLEDKSMQERLGALTTAVDQLTDAIVAKRQRKSLTSAAQSLGDVAVVKLMFRRVSSLLGVFQFETQIRAESLLLMILQKLDTPAQQQVQSIDAVEVILAHMKEQHSSTREIMCCCSRGHPVDGCRDRNPDDLPQVCHLSRQPSLGLNLAVNLCTADGATGAHSTTANFGSLHKTRGHVSDSTTATARSATFLVRRWAMACYRTKLSRARAIYEQILILRAFPAQAHLRSRHRQPRPMATSTVPPER